jgi:hypothetical protein
MHRGRNGHGKPIGGAAERTRQSGDAVSCNQICLAGFLWSDGPLRSLLRFRPDRGRQTACPARRHAAPTGNAAAAAGRVPILRSRHSTPSGAGHCPGSRTRAGLVSRRLAADRAATDGQGGCTDAVTVEAKAAALERIKWLLRHGNAPDAIDDIECPADDIAAALEENSTSASLRKLVATLGEFVTYITNNVGDILNYGERFRAGERISTGFVESAVNQIVDKRFDKHQSMRWTPRDAHLFLQTRTRVLSGDLDQLIRRRYPTFRTTAGNDLAPGL